jgi:putative phosphoesterase
LRIAALYDVHGMLPALEAVLADVEREQVDAIVFGGDIAAGPFPRETAELARTLDAHFIRGNADRRVDPPRPGESWFRSRVGPEIVDWLDGLPEQIVLDDALFCHATPRSDEEVVTPATSDDRLVEVLADVEQTLVVAGHTHMQQDRRVGPIRFVNPGSVGMPYEGEVAAYWALLGDEVELRRTPFDVEAAVAAIRTTSWPRSEEFIAENMLRAATREEAIAAFEPA